MAEKQKIERTPLYTLCRVVFGVLLRTICPVKYYNTQVLDRAEAPYILIANHKSMIDPFVLALPTKKYEIRYVGKRELTKNRLLEWAVKNLHMIPVSRHATDMAAMRSCMQVLKDGEVLGIFPEGTRHQPELMQTVESGAAMIALRAGVPVIPVYISGRVRPFRRIHARVGEPMAFDDIKAQGINAESIQQLCERMRETFYALRDRDMRAK